MAGSKVLKPVAGVVILVGLYAAAGYIGVPAGVRWAVSNVLPDALGGRDATVGDVSFNPWNWSLEINDLAIKSANAPKNNLLTLKHLIFRQTFWYFRHIDIRTPTQLVDGIIN